MNSSQTPVTEPTPTAGDVLQVLFRTTHQLHLQFEEHLSALEIPSYMTGPRLRFLIAVSESAPIRMSELATLIGIKARTVTQYVDALEQENLLIRYPDPEDRRATFLQLTNAAPDLIHKARIAMSQVSEKVLAPLSPESQKHLLDLLYQLTDAKELSE